MNNANLNAYPHDLLIEIFRRMTLIREFETRAIEERRRGLIPGSIFPGIGQEATAVGACIALAPEDVITSTHRSHAHLLAKGADPRILLAELAGRTPGYCKGRGGPMHVADLDLGVLGANGIVAGGLPIAVGAALAFSMRRESRVALAFLGDGAINQGAFHEAANLAGLWKLPVIFFCENNLYGEGTPQAMQSPIADLARRAEGYNFPGIVVDGNDVLAVYDVVQEAVGRARAGEGPTFIEGKTYRFRGHDDKDPQIYRRPGEMAVWQARDPLPAYRKQLIDAGQFTVKELSAIEARIQEKLSETVLFAASAPYPNPKEALDGIYSS